MTRSVPIAWQAYGALVGAASWLHYAVLSRFGKSDEGGAAWYSRRLDPPLPAPAQGRRVWIHAVSAGESKVAELLRQRLLARDPSLSVVLSATTYSGFARVRAVADEAQSFVMPLDTLAAQRRVFETVRPDVLVLVESEFWPAQFAAAAEAGVPVLVGNATMSERSFARHQRNGIVARRTIGRVARIYAQDEAIAGRYAALGVPPDRIEVIGNLKLVPSHSVPAFARERHRLVAFGNVHRDEIDVLAPAVAELRRQHPDLRIALVPRYPGKTPGEVLSASFGADLRMVETLEELADAGPLVWLDQMGTLAAVYARATVGVVCGTFCDVGGHDLSEPLHMGAASVYGPHVERQLPMHAALSALDCATQVKDASELPAVVGELLRDDARRERMVVAFRQVSDGATARLDRLADELMAQLG